MAFSQPANAHFYIPGMSPKYYALDEPVHFNVNALRSEMSLFPKRYYSLPFCRPETVVSVKESFGSLFSGEARQNSLYEARMLRDEKCKFVEPCDVDENNREIRARLAQLTMAIQLGYRAGITVDNLPAFNNGTSNFGNSCASNYTERFQNHRGYFVGVSDACVSETLLNNFLRFKILYNVNPLNDAEYMVVGISVEPFSIDFNDVSCDDKFDPEAHFYTSHVSLNRIAEDGLTVKWAYSVEWIKSDITWATRWDAYFHSSLAGSQQKSHVMHLIFGITVVVLGIGLTVGLLARSVFTDLRRYNLVDTVSDVLEAPVESGWKLIHADVFRPPTRTGLLAVLVGNGSQVLGMGAGVLLVSNFGLLSPSRRGSMLTAVLVFTFMMAIASGFVCGTILNYFNQRDWRYVGVCGSAASGLLIFFLLIADVIYASNSSSASLPASAVVMLLGLWLLNILLTFIGAVLAFKLPMLKNPVKIGPLSREIPEPTSVYTQKWYLFCIPAIAPIVTILLELHFVMQNLWAGQVYYVVGFLTLNCICWVLVTGLVAVVHIYFILCSENHRWWWWSFIVPGSCGFHMALYAVYYYATQTTYATFGSKFLYFVYMGIICGAYGLAAGAVGFFSSFVFIYAIYSRVRVQ